MGRDLRAQRAELGRRGLLGRRLQAAPFERGLPETRHFVQRGHPRRARHDEDSRQLVVHDQRQRHHFRAPAPALRVEDLLHHRGGVNVGRHRAHDHEVTGQVGQPHGVGGEQAADAACGRADSRSGEPVREVLRDVPRRFEGGAGVAQSAHPPRPSASGRSPGRHGRRPPSGCRHGPPSYVGGTGNLTASVRGRKR